MVVLCSHRGIVCWSTLFINIAHITITLTDQILRYLILFLILRKLSINYLKILNDLEDLLCEIAPF